MSKERLYSIKEFAELVGVSRQSIYKSLNQTDSQLVNYMTTIDNQKRIRESALYDIYGIKNSQPNSQPESTKFTDDIIEILKSQIELYKTQLEQKDKQIEQLQKLLENEQKLNLANNPKLLEVVQGGENHDKEQSITVPEQKQPEETKTTEVNKTKSLFNWFKRR